MPRVGCSGVIAYILMRQFEQTGRSIDAQDRQDITISGR